MNVLVRPSSLPLFGLLISFHTYYGLIVTERIQSHDPQTNSGLITYGTTSMNNAHIAIVCNVIVDRRRQADSRPAMAAQLPHKVHLHKKQSITHSE